MSQCKVMTFIDQSPGISRFACSTSKEAVSFFTIVNNMEESVKKPFLAGGTGSDGLEINHQLLLLKKNVRQTRWLKAILVLLYIPSVALFPLPYLQRSGFRHPQPRQHYTYSDMILSELASATCREKICMLSF